MMPRTSRTPARQLMTIQLTLSAMARATRHAPRMMKTRLLRVAPGTMGALYQLRVTSYELRGRISLDNEPVTRNP